VPVVDAERGVLVVRIVYDGPPMSGKTTTIRALAERLGAGTVRSPEEMEGRTTFFDWAQYVGGIFEGRRIHCQIVSVPGQVELRHRRQFLVESADAVVFVADTRASALPTGLNMLRDLVSDGRRRDPPLGVVFQANKRDDPDAVPREALRGILDAVCPMVLVDSVATAAEGVREAFVFAVRLALDRARALAASGQLTQGVPSESDALDLLERMRSIEAGPSRSEPRGDALDMFGELEHLLPRSSESTSWTPGDEIVFVADPMMPGGQIWPPVDGRTLVHEVARLRLVPVRTARGEWWASGSGWRFHSAAAALYGDPYEARRHLIDWARLHASGTGILTASRALLLADVGGGRQRMWQLVRAEPSLRERLAAPALDAESLARELEWIGDRLLEARASFEAAPMALPCTLWTVSASERPRFVGLMPGPGDDAEPEPDGEELLERELGPQLEELERQRSDYDVVRDRLRSLSRDRVVGATLASLA
jgi:signal recognition particle receptor subunit beta